MTSKFFFFTREETVKKLDENGKLIPITIAVKDDAGLITEQPTGQFETELVSYTNSFNLDKVIRVHSVSKNEVVVLLDDGHEVSEAVPTLKNKDKKPPFKASDIIEVKSRIWVQSEIHIKGDEIIKLYEELNRM